MTEMDPATRVELEEAAGEFEVLVTALAEGISGDRSVQTLVRFACEESLRETFLDAVQAARVRKGLR